MPPAELTPDGSKLSAGLFPGRALKGPFLALGDLHLAGLQVEWDQSELRAGKRVLSQSFETFPVLVMECQILPCLADTCAEVEGRAA